jgi:hypothetical protein
MQGAMDSLTSHGWATTFHPDTLVLINQQNVFGYYSVNFQPSNKVLNNTWAKGSIAEILFPHSAGTFELSSNVNNDLLIANLISEGATGAHGYAYYTYTSTSLNPGILFDHYTDSVSNYNLAESYYMAIRQLSWQSIIIGDPKTSIIIDNTSAIVGIDLTNQINIYPNPSMGNLIIETSNIRVNAIKVFNQTGQQIKAELERNNNGTFSLDLSTPSSGVYYVNLETDLGLISEKILVVR